MIAINDAIVFAAYYMIFGSVVSTFTRRIIKPSNFKEDLAATALVIIWPLIVLLYVLYFISGVIEAIKKRIRD